MYLQKIFIVICLIGLNLCYGDDWHFSIASMSELFDFETERINIIETYISNEFKRLDDIRRFIEQRQIQNAKELEESYTESSINAFKTILRIKNDWETLKNQMARTSAIGDFKRGSVTYDNVLSAFKAIRRLQIVYELEVQFITNGIVENYIFEKFDVDDCYLMASLCYDNAEFHCAHDWFTEAYNKYKEDNSTSSIDYPTFITKYAWSSYLVGHVHKAKWILYDFMQANNELTEILNNLKYIIWSKKQVFKRNTANDPNKRFYSHSLQNLDNTGEVRSFITTCQNENFTSGRLDCRYYHGGHRFLMIGPLREERISVTPDIKMYHNILCDSEIQKIKHLAKPKLERLSTDTNEDITLRKSAVFNEHNDRVFGVIHNRLSLISSTPGYNGSNKYVVTNYGLSGHYLPHSAYIDDDHLINGRGREDLVICHMDDVSEGGATVIPELRVHVPSIKGSALIVRNARRSSFGGVASENVQYGSCPIFYGDKWTLMTRFEAETKRKGV